MTKTIKIYCCGCKKDIDARLTSGVEIYPHREDLAALPFWKCDVCKNYVGCHHKTQTPTKPLGNIPTPEIRKARSRIHQILDPLWKTKKYKRRDLYKFISKKIGYEFHTSEIKTIQDANQIANIIEDVKKNGL